jgi:pimeloyl-ACP methyl ester carboxylesterase
VTIAVVLTVLLASGAVVQAVLTARDGRANPAPGRLINVGGHRLHLYCTGTGSPTVVLEAALPGTSSEWAWVQGAVARTTRVCSYDRAGYVWSEPSPGPRDAKHIAVELHRLLRAAGIGGPYVLVGHSMGGVYVREYAALYATSAAGMVLVDAASPDQWTRIPGYSLASTRQQADLAPLLARFGIMRLWTQSLAAGLPARARRAATAFYGATWTWETDAAEVDALPATDAEVQADSTSLGALPLEVVTAGGQEFSAAQERVWQQLQRELAGLSRNGHQHTIAGATHLSLVFDRRGSEPTVAAILQVVRAARERRA